MTDSGRFATADLSQSLRQLQPYNSVSKWTWRSCRCVWCDALLVLADTPTTSHMRATLTSLSLLWHDMTLRLLNLPPLSEHFLQFVVTEEQQPHHSVWLPLCRAVQTHSCLRRLCKQCIGSYPVN